MTNNIKDELTYLIQEGMDCRTKELHNFALPYIRGSLLNEWMQKCKDFLNNNFKLSNANVEFCKENNYQSGGIELKRFDILIKLLKDLFGV